MINCVQGIDCVKLFRDLIVINCVQGIDFDKLC